MLYVVGTVRKNPKKQIGMQFDEAAFFDLQGKIKNICKVYEWNCADNPILHTYVEGSLGGKKNSPGKGLQIMLL